MFRKKDSILHCRISSVDKDYISDMAKNENMSPIDYIIYKLIYSDSQSLKKYNDYIQNRIENNK